VALAKVTEYADSSTCPAELVTGFYTVWFSCSSAEKVWKSSGFAKRQAKNIQTAFESGQKTVCTRLNRFYSIVKVLSFNSDPGSGFNLLSGFEM
jgi:hypothetical protein